MLDLDDVGIERVDHLAEPRYGREREEGPPGERPRPRCPGGPGVARPEHDRVDPRADVAHPGGRTLRRFVLDECKQGGLAGRGDPADQLEVAHPRTPLGRTRRAERHE